MRKKLQLLLAALVLLISALSQVPLGYARESHDASRNVVGAHKTTRADIDSRVLRQIKAEGKATFWVLMKDKADLSRARTIQNWTQRGRFVVQRLKTTARESQAEVRASLTKLGIRYTPFWIANTIKVTAGLDVVRMLASQPGVDQIRADGRYRIPKPTPSKRRGVDTVEWNIDRVNAPDVWDTFGIRGEEIVVANIDTGVQYDHPAVVAQYRGNLGGGSFDHNYNWFDPSQICGTPSMVPCDNAGHGTHTMGTMVGDDGDPGVNQIGVAPHAKWIAAKGCEDFFCSFEALFATGEWVLAPEDLNGENPRPDLRPHIVNNSWGGGPGDPFYQAIVDSWNASGIFPQFSNGNSGPSCGSSGSPGDYINSYSAGAFDINDQIAFFSSRGPSFFGGEAKPNIAAPGVGVRSSVPTDSYALFDGTSMASPHVAGTVALMWSGAPALIGDITATRDLLDQTAIDTDDLSCGGTLDDNNVWGEGRLDSFAAVEQSPRGPTGTLAGTVTNADDGTPIEGAKIEVVGAVTREVLTDAAGQYSMLIPVGTYDVTASIFGFLTQTASAEVLEDQTTIQDFALEPAPSHTVSGVVTDGDGNPVEGATVEVLETPIPPVTTDASGTYTFPSVPEGEYDFQASASQCLETVIQHMVVDGDETLDFTLNQRTDNFGYFCDPVETQYVDATTDTGLTGDDAAVTVDLPFPFTLYGETFNSANIVTNGYVSFTQPDVVFENVAIPDAAPPNSSIYAFWDDLFIDVDSAVQTELIGEAPNRQFVIEWQNAHFCCISPETVNAEIVLYEDGRIGMNYAELDDANTREQGDSATVGLENSDGTDAFQYSYNDAVLSSGLSIVYDLPPNGFIEGTVTDANDGLPIAGATVRALQGGTEIRSTTTEDDGTYRVQVPVGDYDVEATAENYSTESAPVSVPEDGAVVTQDFVLETARGEISPDSLEFTLTPDSTETQTLELSNTGSSDLTWEVLESGGGPAAAAAEGRGKWLYRSKAGVTVRTHNGANAKAHPSAYRWVPKAGPTADSVLIYADDFIHTAPNTFLDQALQSLGQAYTAHYDADFAGFEADLASQSWDVVLFGDDNYQPPPSTFDALNDYVNGGGKLILNSWQVGVSPGHPLWDTLGFSWVSDDFDPPDPVFWWEPDHPVFTQPESVPEATDLTGGIYGIYGQHVEPAAGAEAIAGYTTPGPDPDQAAMVLANDNRTIYKGFLDGQNSADQDADGVMDGVELWINMFSGIDNGFFNDVPWLSEDPTSGTVAPGDSQLIDVTVDTTGMAPGAYEAQLTFRTNSGRQPTLKVPVHLLVTGYMQGVNAGGAAYTDTSGLSWAADQQFTPGSFGYTNPGSAKVKKLHPIWDTLDDYLYRTARTKPGQYRFDGLPAGTYEVDLRFAEIENKHQGQRLFDVVAEGDLILAAHDIAGEVGRWRADDHSFLIEVTDGRLDVQFVERFPFGKPTVSGIRVFHRPDM